MIGTIISLTMIWWLIGMVVMFISISGSEYMDKKWENFVKSPNLFSYFMFLNVPHVWPIFIGK